jgi:hypothetical protein
MEDKLNPPGGMAQTYPEHDCNDWRRKVYFGGDGYRGSECGVCGKILSFQFDSIWKHISQLWIKD